MKSQKMIRVQLLMVGLGAALMLASSARAQQDIDPTTFDVNPGVSQADNGAAVRTAQNSPVATEMNAEAAAVSIDADASEAALAQWTPTDTTVGLVLIAGMLSIVVYAAAASQLRHLPRISSQSRPYVPTTGATAH